MASPSDCVNSPAAIKETVENPSGPRYGRPSDRFGPPTALFSRELAILKYDLDHLEALTPDLATVENAFKLILHSTAFYTDERDRESHLWGNLSDLLPREQRLSQSAADRAAKPDGVRFEGLFAYLIFQLKNEQGLGGDPFLQSLVVYSKIIGQKQVSSIPLSLPWPFH
jgi:hypothetical protein